MVADWNTKVSTTAGQRAAPTSSGCSHRQPALWQYRGQWSHNHGLCLHQTHLGRLPRQLATGELSLFTFLCTLPHLFLGRWRTMNFLCKVLHLSTWAAAFTCRCRCQPEQARHQSFKLSNFLCSMLRTSCWVAALACCCCCHPRQSLRLSRQLAIGELAPES